MGAWRLTGFHDLEALGEKEGGLRTEMCCGTEQVLASLLLREKLHEGQRSDLQWTGKEAADASWAPRKVQSGSEPLGRGSGSREKGSGEEEAACVGPQVSCEQERKDLSELKMLFELSVGCGAEIHLET